MTINSVLLNYLDEEELAYAKEIINRRKISKNFPDFLIKKKEEDTFLSNVLNKMEFAAISIWNPEKENADKFREICSNYFEILKCLPLPENEIRKAIQVIKLIVYSYLGEKWESGRRYLIENEEIIHVNNDSVNWDERLFKTIYLAIIYLLRKNSWTDLEKAIEMINVLRKEQKEYENNLFKELDQQKSNTKAYELAALYHLAKVIELVGTYHLEGRPYDIYIKLNYHLENAISYTDDGNIIELNLIIRMLKPTFEKMIANSLWIIAHQINSKFEKFVQTLIKAKTPIIELLYPQRYSIIENGLLNPTHKAVVINLPTSAGKTLIAEFRILQALNQFFEENGWVAYVAPTRALVNQIAIRLRNHLSKEPLNLVIEKMSGALEIDAYENELIKKEDKFNILVVTPEKLNLLIRQGIEEEIGRPLVLVIVDEAHNIESRERGINLETLLSIINKDCEKANFLLMSPLIPNTEELASWLDPVNPKGISLSLNYWRPNDLVIGSYSGNIENEKIVINYKPLITSNDTLVIDEEIKILVDPLKGINKRDLNTKYKLTSIFASELKNYDNILIIAKDKNFVFQIADQLYDWIEETESLDEEIILVQKFVANELGEQYPLVKYMNKKIGIHHAGLPDDVRCLMELLMEKNKLKYLIATTTIAQGINFQISTILMSAYHYPWMSHMPTRDFWNLVGRTGRIYSSIPGIVGIAVKDSYDSEDGIKVMKFIQKGTERLLSSLVDMVEQVIERGWKFNLQELYYIPEWSMFLQYLSHMFKQTDNLNKFIAEAEMNLKRTYGYNQLNESHQKILLNSVKEYAKELSISLAETSDSTGFSSETIKSITGQVRRTRLKMSDLDSSSLFSDNPINLRKLVGIMLRTPEIRKNLREIKIRGKEIHYITLSRLISDWVLGKDIIEISNNYFGGMHHNNISECVNSIYGKLTHSATWGLSSFQKLLMRKSDFDNLNEIERKRLLNIPAMIYYGVRTNEAILLRKALVPRSISNNLGNQLKNEYGDNTYNMSIKDISNWLNNLNVIEWKKAIPTTKKMEGLEYKKIWQMLSGYV